MSNDPLGPRVYTSDGEPVRLHLVGDVDYRFVGMVDEDSGEDGDGGDKGDTT